MPDRSDHAHGAGAAGTGEDSSRNAVPAARSSNSIPQTADYADYEMERSVLACVLADPTCFNTVATRLGVRILPGSQGKDSADRALTGYARNAKIMFRDPKYAAIYQSMLEVNSRTGNPPDLLSVEDDLLRSGRLEMIGGTGALFDIQASIGSVANVETWCGILRQWAMLREMINACTSALQICREPGVHGKEHRAVTVRGLCLLYHRRYRKNRKWVEKTLRGEAGGLYQGWFQKRAESRNPIYVFL